MRQYFKQQLDTVDACNGDYLNGESFDSVVDRFIAEAEKATVINPLTFEPEKRLLSREDAMIRVNKRIELYKQHAGEKLVYFLVDRTDEPMSTMEVLKCWESEIDDLASSYIFDRYSGKSDVFPVFRKM